MPPRAILDIGPRQASVLIAPAAQGARGAPGPTGPDAGFGQIRYAEAAGSPPILIPANTRTQLMFAIDPTQTNDYLNPPFVGHQFWVGNKIIPRAMGDLMDVLVNLLVTSLVAGGQVRVDIDVGSPAGPVGADTASLFSSAGIAERVTLRLRAQVLTYFLANGAALYLTSTQPLTIVNEALLINVPSIYAGITAS